jgi:predicted aspartyl protease
MRCPKLSSRFSRAVSFCTVALAIPLISRGVAVAQPHSTTFDTERSEQWIPYEGADDHQIIIPVSVNGEPMHALVDTGTSDTVLSLEWAKRHSLSVHPSGTSSALNGTQVQVWAAPFQTLSIAAFGRTNGEMRAADLSSFRAVENAHPFDMLIGFDLLSHFAIDIDAEHSRIRFRMTGAPRPAGQVVPLQIAPKTGHFFTSLSVEGKVLSTVMIDTGEDTSLALTKAAIGALPKEMRVTDVMKAGAGGIAIADYALSDHVRWGAVKADRVPTEFESKPINGAIPARIGMEFLERWNVFIDGTQGVMILSDRQNPAPAAHTTNMGIQFNMTAAGMTAVHVMKNSPALAAGLKDGDRICAADGSAITPSSSIPRGPDGSTMNLTLCDGRKISFKRGTFY